MTTRRLHHDDDGPFGGVDDDGGGEGTVGPTNMVMAALLDPRTGPNFNYPVRRGRRRQVNEKDTHIHTKISRSKPAPDFGTLR